MQPTKDVAGAPEPNEQRGSGGSGAVPVDALAEAAKRLMRDYCLFYAEYRAEPGFERRDENLAKLAEVENAIDRLAARAPQQEAREADSRAMALLRHLVEDITHCPNPNDPTRRFVKEGNGPRFSRMVNEAARQLRRAAPSGVPQDSAPLPISVSSGSGAADTSLSAASKSRCRVCGGAMLPGKAMESTIVRGMADFPGESMMAVTMYPGGPGRLVDCIKCSACGHSVSGQMQADDATHSGREAVAEALRPDDQPSRVSGARKVTQGERKP